MIIAITREISTAVNKCELTYLQRQPIDLELARLQHSQYRQALQSLGCKVFCLVEEKDLADSVFVEDTAIVLDELAIITRPGAVSRRMETPSIAKALSQYRDLFYIQEPGTIDGGDVLQVGKRIYIGVSSRTNLSAINQIQNILHPLNYQVIPVEVKSCLHLKSAVTLCQENTLLINRDFIDSTQFQGLKFIDVDAKEPHAANALLVLDTIIYPSMYPKTLHILEKHSIKIKAIDVTELIKAEGAVTCCSLILKVN